MFSSNTVYCLSLFLSLCVLASGASALERIEWQEQVDIVYLDELKTIRKRLLSWADDWSAGDATAVIAYYVDDYSGNVDPGNDRQTSRRQWLAQREKRITPERKIQVDLLIKDLFMDSEGYKATIIFEQNYSSKTYRDRVSKKMLWKKSNGVWLIRKESVVQE